MGRSCWMIFPSSDFCSDHGVDGYKGWSGDHVIYCWDKRLLGERMGGKEEKIFVNELLVFCFLFFFSLRYVQQGIEMVHDTSA